MEKSQQYVKKNRDHFCTNILRFWEIFTKILVLYLFSRELSRNYLFLQMFFRKTRPNARGILIKKMFATFLVVFAKTERVWIFSLKWNWFWAIFAKLRQNVLYAISQSFEFLRKYKQAYSSEKGFSDISRILACAPMPRKSCAIFSPQKRKIVIEAFLILVTGKSSAGKKSATVRKLITIGWIPSSENSFYSIERDGEMKGGREVRGKLQRIELFIIFFR